eukprot:3934422-Rhodomonas_salina.5
MMTVPSSSKFRIPPRLSLHQLPKSDSESPAGGRRAGSDGAGPAGGRTRASAAPSQRLRLPHCQFHWRYWQARARSSGPSLQSPLDRMVRRLVSLARAAGNCVGWNPLLVQITAMVVEYWYQVWRISTEYWTPLAVSTSGRVTECACPVRPSATGTEDSYKSSEPPNPPKHARRHTFLGPDATLGGRAQLGGEDGQFGDGIESTRPVADSLP